MSVAPRVHHHPPFDCGSAAYQDLRDRFENAAFPEGDGLDEYLTGVDRTYADHHAKPLVRAVAWLAVAAGDGDGQQAWADRIAIDRSALSDGLRLGELGSRPLSNLLGDPRVAAGVLERHDAIALEMGRAAFVAAAAYTSGFEPGRNPATPPLDVADYEVVCGIVEARDGRDLDVPADAAEVAEVVAGLAKRPRVLTPAWATARERRVAAAAVRDAVDLQAAVRRTRRLQRDWLGVLAYAWAATEGLGNEALWWDGQ